MIAKTAATSAATDAGNTVLTFAAVPSGVHVGVPAVVCLGGHAGNVFGAPLNRVAVFCMPPSRTMLPGCIAYQNLNSTSGTGVAGVRVRLSAAAGSDSVEISGLSDPTSASTILKDDQTGGCTETEATYGYSGVIYDRDIGNAVWTPRGAGTC